jgi:hypothetical protein
MATKAARKRANLKSQNYVAHVVKEEVPEVPPSLYSRDLVYYRERALAQAASAEFDRWLAWHIAGNRIPMDEVMRPVELLMVYVEWILLARVLVGWECRYDGRRPPHIYIPHDHHPNPDRSPRSESEALAMGLTIISDSPAASYPGCRGKDVNGDQCGGLRKYGEELCPMCKSRSDYEIWEKNQRTA